MFYKILTYAFFIYFATASYNASGQAINWKNIDKEKIRIPGLNWDKPYVFDKIFKSYFDYYGLNIANVDHYFGVFCACGYKLCTHIFIPKNPKGTVFLLHGYLDHSGILKNLIVFLIENGYAVLSYDMPGHGLSSGKKASIKSFLEYSAILKEMAISYDKHFKGPIHLIGHSTGGAAAIDYILREPDNQFDKIILIAPLIHSYAWRLSKAGTLIISPFVSKIPRKFRKNSSDPDFIRFEKKDPLQYRFVPIKWVKAFYRWNERLKDYPVSSKKVFVIQGDRDTTVDWKYNMKVICDKFPKSEILLIKNGRHHLVNESVDIRKKVLSRIIQELSIPESSSSKSF